MNRETFGILIMGFSLIWMVGFMFGYEVAMFCVSCALLQVSIGYIIAIRSFFKIFEEE
jgi:hypothetical protein